MRDGETDCCTIRLLIDTGSGRVRKIDFGSVDEAATTAE